MIAIKQLIAALERTGKTKSGLATYLGLRNSAITEILAGDRTVKADELPRIVEYLELDRVPVMGRIGAGGSIEPDYEQVVADELGTVRVPIALPGELVAFEVRGESMRPRYDAGDIVVVWAEQKRATETLRMMLPSTGTLTALVNWLYSSRVVSASAKIMSAPAST